MLHISSANMNFPDPKSPHMCVVDSQLAAGAVPGFVLDSQSAAGAVLGFVPKSTNKTHPDCNSALNYFTNLPLGDRVKLCLGNLSEEEQQEFIFLMQVLDELKNEFCRFGLQEEDVLHAIDSYLIKTFLSKLGFHINTLCRFNVRGRKPAECPSCRVSVYLMFFKCGFVSLCYRLCCTDHIGKFILEKCGRLNKIPLVQSISNPEVAFVIKTIFGYHPSLLNLPGFRELSRLLNVMRCQEIDGIFPVAMLSVRLSSFGCQELVSPVPSTATTVVDPSQPAPPILTPKDKKEKVCADLVVLEGAKNLSSQQLAEFAELLARLSS